MDRSGFMMRWRMGRRSLGALALLFGLIAWYYPQPAEAQVTFTQITNTTGGGDAFGECCSLVNRLIGLNLDGTRIAFSSTADLTGGNPDSNQELFLWTQGSGLTQITNTTGGGNVYPSINADGTRIAFSSNRDLTGGNPDGSLEIFLWTQGSGFTQTTTGIYPGLWWPSINADGTLIAFASDFHGGLPISYDFEIQLFLWTQGSGFTPITNTTPASFGYYFPPSINADGTRIAFRTRYDLTGGNPDHNIQIFLWTQGSGFTQITNATTWGAIGTLSINADGTRIAFSTTADLTGGNPDSNQELFLWTQGSGLTQITNTTGGWNHSPSISADGTRIAFSSNRDLTGGNPDGSLEIFLWTQGSGFTPITNAAAREPSISADGTRIAFLSTSDLVPGGNPDGNAELFLAQISTVPPNPPVLSVSPSSLDFGTIAVGASKDLTFTVTNTGGGTLTGTASASAPYSILPTASFSLSAGQSQDITVRFSPTTGGTFVSNVSVTSNGGSASPQVQGVGALPHIDSLADPGGTLTITSNAVGSLVSIKGSYFGTNATNHVSLCGTTPTIAHWEETVIVFVVPSLAVGTVCQVQVVAPAGSSNAVSFTVIAPLSLSGLIRTSAGRGIASVRVSITGGRVSIVTTTSRGAYSQAGLPNGVYTLTPVLSGYEFTPSTQQVTLNGANAANVNFTGTLAVPVIASVSPSTGPASTKVTIKGTGFGNPAPSGNAVLFGSAAVSITSWSPTKIIVLAPAGSGSVLVTVQTGVGTDHPQTSNAKAFTYSAPLPTNVHIIPSGDFQALIFGTFQTTQSTPTQAVATISIENNTRTWYVVYPSPPAHVSAEPPLPTQPFLMSPQQELPLGQVTFTRPNPMRISFLARNDIDLTTCNTPTALATSACDQTRFVLAALGWDLFYRVITGNVPSPNDTPSITGLLLALGAQNPLINLGINIYNKDLPGIIEQLQDAIYDDALNVILTTLNLPTELPGWWDFYWRAGLASELLVETLIYPHTGTLTFTGY